MPQVEQERHSEQGLWEQDERERWMAETRSCLPSPTMAGCLGGSSLKRKPKGFNQDSDSPKKWSTSVNLAAKKAKDWKGDRRAN